MNPHETVHGLPGECGQPWIHGQEPGLHNPLYAITHLASQ